MTKEELIKNAAALTPPSKASATEFNEKSERLAAELNEQMSARKDLEALVGTDNTGMMQDNSRNMVRFMGSLLANYNPETFVETVLWVFRAYRSHGFRLTFWSAFIDTFTGILKERMTEEAYKEIYPFYNWIIVHIPAFVQLTDGKDGG